MDLQNILEKGVDIISKPIVEYPLPDNTALDRWLLPGVAVIQGTKFKNIDKRGVFSVNAGLVADIVYGKPELTPSGLIFLNGKGPVKLLSGNCTLLAGDECDEAKDLGEGFYAKRKKKLWALFRVSDGAQLSDYLFTEVSSFSDGTFAATTKAGTQILDAGCRPVLPQTFEYAWPFKNGFARIRTKKQISYIDRAGNMIFSGAGRSSRDFQNGFAVITDKADRMGAIDETGRVVISPQYKFLKDAENNRFVASNSGNYQVNGNGAFLGRDYGLLDTEGRTVLPLKYGRIELQPNGTYKFGDMVIWQKNEGNRVLQYGVLVFGIADADGNTLLPKKFVSVGSESEGLCAYKSYEGSTLCFGYMTPDGKSAFTLASIDYSSALDRFDRVLLREEIALQLLPFKEGRAKVCIKTGETTVGVFKKTTQISAVKTSWYEIDTAGHPVAGSSAASDSSDPLLEQLVNNNTLPFADSYRQFKSSPMMNKTLLESVLKLHPFEDMYEADYTFGFAILDKDLNCVCANDDGLPREPFQFIYTPAGRHDTYTSLFRLADNVWQFASQNNTDVVFSVFESPTRFSCGLAPFRKLTDKNKYLWGYMDHHGNILISPRYTFATGFQNGYAFVQDGEKSFILFRETEIKER